jgi:rare lipoprotein A
MLAFSKSNKARRAAIVRFLRECSIAAALAGSLSAFSGTTADAKTPGKTYCFLGTCHYVRTIAETRQLVGKTVVVKASFYDDCKKDNYNPCGLTSSGEPFRSWKADNAASPVHPDGTKLLVWHPKTKKTLVVRVNNAGPYWGDRKLDLSRAAADKLGVAAGVTSVHVRVLEAPSQKEATYQRNRTYPPVPGYVGIFADIDRAFSDIGRSIAGLFASPAQAETKVAAQPKNWARRSALGAPTPGQQTQPAKQTSTRPDSATPKMVRRGEMQPNRKVQEKVTPAFR